MSLAGALRSIGLLEAPVRASPFVVAALRLLRPLSTYTIVSDKSGGAFTSAMTELRLDEATRLYHGLTVDGESVSIGDDSTFGPTGWRRTFKPPKREGFAYLGTVGGTSRGPTSAPASFGARTRRNGAAGSSDTGPRASRA